MDHIQICSWETLLTTLEKFKSPSLRDCRETWHLFLSIPNYFLEIKNSERWTAKTFLNIVLSVNKTKSHSNSSFHFHGIHSCNYNYVWGTSSFCPYQWRTYAKPSWIWASVLWFALGFVLLTFSNTSNCWLSDILLSLAPWKTSTLWTFPVVASDYVHSVTC